MQDRKIVSPAEWRQAREALLAEEKEFTRLRDKLSARRCELPWERVEKSYVFEGPRGPETLADLFAGRSQLIVQHLMYPPEWENPCKSCSFWADQHDAIMPHLNARDVTLVAVSRAPLARIEAFKQRMGWKFHWASCARNDFNYDFHTSFWPDDLAAGPVDYNYRELKTGMTDLPGYSVFTRGQGADVFHTYSCYARGLDMLNAAYHFLDIAPKGRDESGSHPMAWVRHHDAY